MSIAEFIAETTVESPGSGVTLAQLRRAYSKKYGACTRGAFIAAASAAGFNVVAPPMRQSFIAGRRALTPAAA